MPEINNNIYEQLGERWYQAYDDPVALLRAEADLRNPWIDQKIRNYFGEDVLPAQIKTLDVACGAGFLSNYLATKDYQVHGIDLSPESLKVAAKYDKTHKVRYDLANAGHLPFKDNCFDVVTAMDFLEHVDDPARMIKEISRVLRPNGIFFFHTFNRSFFSWLVAIKAVEIFVKNTPRHMHVLKLFIKPEELDRYCRSAHLVTKEWVGLKPELFKQGVISSFLKRRVSKNFSFSFTPSLSVGYSGYAVKVVDQ